MTKHTNFELWFNEWGWLWFFLIPVFGPAIPAVWIAGGQPFHTLPDWVTPTWITVALVLFIFLAVMKHRYTIKQVKIEKEEWDRYIVNNHEYFEEDSL